ncbi:MAG: hypothetical protein H0U97_08830, partial [Gammaproteobacteria bacterium]|nr:hypothetical protein [Gammaproteobacteria bacterium]
MIQKKANILARLGLALCILLASLAAVAQSVGGIYVNTNQVNNEVWSYSRTANGTLTLVGKYSTQGTGTG